MRVNERLHLPPVNLGARVLGFAELPAEPGERLGVVEAPERAEGEAD